MKQSERLDICIAVTLALILALACLPAHCKREKKLVDLEIPVACAKRILLEGCDPLSDPPKCQKIFVEYRPASCAIVHKKEKN